jgi:hypothetical protein
MKTTIDTQLLKGLQMMEMDAQPTLYVNCLLSKNSVAWRCWRQCNLWNASILTEHERNFFKWMPTKSHDYFNSKKIKRTTLLPPSHSLTLFNR